MGQGQGGGEAAALVLPSASPLAQGQDIKDPISISVSHRGEDR